jgi:hypothetical protein
MAVMSSVIADVMSQVSCLNFIVMAVLPQLSNLSLPILAALSFHILAILSSLYHPGCHLQLSFPGCPVQAFLSQLFCPSIPVPALLPPCTVFVVMFSLSYLFCPTGPVLGVLSWKHTDCPVLAVQGSPYMADQKLKN